MPFLNRIGSGATKKFGFGAGVKPGAPTIGTATRGDQQVSVAFTPPDALGTGTPTYTATSSPGGFTAVGFSSPLVVTGLANGTAYTFTVKAENPFGFSTSDSSNSVTPAGVPAQVATPTASLPATYGNTTASVSWTAPAANGSALTDYFIQFSSNGGSSWTTFTDGVSTATSVTVTGLTNGTAYVFRVAAVNSVGNGSYSSASNSATPLAGKIPTPVIGDIAETTSSIPWCFDTTYYNNYTPVQDDGTYSYVYYDFNVNAPNDQNGSCHGWTGLGENVYRSTYLKVTKTGWADSDAIFIEETTNATVVPPFFPFFPFFPTFDPCAGYVCGGAYAELYEFQDCNQASFDQGCFFGGWWKAYGDPNCGCPATFAAFQYCTGYESCP
jgi:hypothetical protein